MEKLKEYKGVIILILIVLVAAFYWYEWRPGTIRERCFTEGEFNQSDSSLGSDRERAIAIDDYYKACLHRFGLKQ